MKEEEEDVEVEQMAFMFPFKSLSTIQDKKVNLLLLLESLFLLFEFGPDFGELLFEQSHWRVFTFQSNLPERQWANGLPATPVAGV